MKNDMLNFNVIKFFGINTHRGKVLRPLPVRQEFPSPGWIKINNDGDVRVSWSCYLWSIFRGSIEKFISVFSAFLEVQIVMVDEFYGVIHAMEETQKMRLTNVQLECDSVLVCVAFTARTKVPWMLRNRQITCLNYCEKIRFRVTHIFLCRECVC